MRSTFKYLIGVGLILGGLIFFSAYNSDDNHVEDKESLVLIWSDEFEYDGLPNPELWSYDVGDACDKPAGCGWGNAELQYYTEKDLSNARVMNGNLVIEAHKSKMKNSDYTSARLVSRGKGDFKYGKIKVRAKLPSGKGTWPAIWMLSSDWKYGGWPESGEIDIMEHVGYMPDTILGTVHTKAFNHLKGTHQGDSIYHNKVEQEFHEYSIDWTADKIDFYMDDNLYFTFQNKNQGWEQWPFDQPFYLIMNLAVGGHWGGKHGVDESIWPQQMLVDYVRVYEHYEVK